MDADRAACPSCGKEIEPRPRRNRRCPHCRRWVMVRHGSLLSEADARAFDERKKAEATPAAAPRPAGPKEELRGLVAEVLREMAEGQPAETRFADFKVFRSSLSTWESLFAKVAEFISQLGPGRVISVSHSEDGNEAVVTVWHWTAPRWHGIGVPEGQEKGGKSPSS
jgi:hypothetical protein